MGHLCLLITMLCEESFNGKKFTDLVKVAVKTAGEITQEDLDYFREEDVNRKLRDLLPTHCQDFGEIVDVERIFEVKE